MRAAPSPAPHRALPPRPLPGARRDPCGGPSSDTPGLADIELFAGLDEAALTAAVDGLRSEPWAASQPQVRCFAIEDAVVHLVDRARMAGAVRESVTIALGRLAEAGEIEVRNRTLTIRTPDQPPGGTLR